jgi:type II secretory pathway component PulF
VRGGASLAGAMRAYPKLFDPLYVAMVAAGEEGGALPPVLARLAGHLEERAELRSQLRASLLYPALLTVVSGVGVTVLLLFVLPRFAEMLADVGGTLPTSTRLLLGASRVLVGWWWLWLALLVALGTLARRHAASGAWHARRLTWPLVGELERAWATARLTRTLGILLGSGVPVLPSLRIARASVGNAAIARAVERGESAVANGARVADALADALPPLAQRLLAVGEESGRLAELCASVAETYDGEVRRTTRALVGMVEPALVLLFGAVVGWIALAMLQAIYSVNARSF